MSEEISSIGVVGGGAWGTALATVIARAGCSVRLWAREAEVVDAINTAHENTTFLPGVPVDASIHATNDLSEFAGVEAILLVTPAQVTRAVSENLKAHVGEGTPVAICAKGIERGTGKFMSEVLEETLPQAQTMVLSGPSFAADVARGLPTAITFAGPTVEGARPVAEAIAIASFRPYLSDDIIGAQVGGAVKNVLAIACGIVEGKGFGESARAALTTRAFAELRRFGSSVGARPETLAGLSGLGDLILTCNSTQSRNMSLGLGLGQGKSMEEIMASRKSVAEGAHTAPILTELATRAGIDMPICNGVSDIVSGKAGVDQTIEELLNRPLRAEDE
ncbi:MAG: NAD(P)H-dependent glycerol-3-phosphate dehydrogenase [Hyphomicrobiales bacterium]